MIDLKIFKTISRTIYTLFEIRKILFVILKQIQYFN